MSDLKTNELVRRNDLSFKKNMRFTSVGYFICNIKADLNELQVCCRQTKKFWVENSKLY